MSLEALLLAVLILLELGFHVFLVWWFNRIAVTVAGNSRALEILLEQRARCTKFGAPIVKQLSQVRDVSP